MLIRKRTTRAGVVRWQALVRRKGHPDTVATFDSRREAEAWGAVEDARRMTRPRLAGDGRRTVADLIDAYKPRAGLLASSADRLRHLDFWRVRLGSFRLQDIDPGTVALVRDELLAEKLPRGRRRSEQTVRHYVNALSAVMEWATRELRWLDANPVRAVRKPKQAAARVSWLEPAEEARLLAACAASGNRDLHDVVMIAVTSGARFGEIVGLRWAQVDFARRVAWLSAEDTKTAEPRAIPLSHAVVAALRARARPINDAPIFGAAGAIRSAWKVARRKAGMPSLRFHDLRHSAATAMLRSGTDSRIVARVLGHRTLAMMARYQHVGVDSVVAAVDRVAARG